MTRRSDKTRSFKCDPEDTVSPGSADILTVLFVVLLGTVVQTKVVLSYSVNKLRGLHCLLTVTLILSVRVFANVVCMRC